MFGSNGSLFGSSGIDGIFSSLENDINNFLGIGVTAQPTSSFNFTTLLLIGGGVLIVFLLIK